MAYKHPSYLLGLGVRHKTLLLELPAVVSQPLHCRFQDPRSILYLLVRVFRLLTEIGELPDDPVNVFDFVLYDVVSLLQSVVEGKVFHVCVSGL